MIKIAFFSVALNHHQAPLADELFELTNYSFVFVELCSPCVNNTKGSIIDYSGRPYLIKAWGSVEERERAREVALTAEVALFGAGLEYLRLRMAKGLLSFEVGERWLKRGWINILSPRLLKNLWYYHFYRWKDKPIYKLCASAYGALDQYRLHSFINRCYKWGYFTKAEDIDVKKKSVNDGNSNSVSIMWCARFLSWKHPETIPYLAHMLKKNGHNVNIDMYGSGGKMGAMEVLCKKLGVDDIVCLKGNVSNSEVKIAMRQHDIFVFTSDKNEGWGVVLNEAMSNGCAVVASNEIGAVPFLIKDGENGFVFKFGDIESLYDKVVSLIEDPDRRCQMSVKAYQTITEAWSPRQAAKNLLQLISDLQQGADTSIKEGPCSKAQPSIIRYA